MPDRSRPWSAFYWSDWESDAALRQCSLAAQGLWMRLLCICAKSEPVGYLAISGVDLDVAAVATAVSRPETEVASLMEELAKWGVFSRDRKGRIYCRRMVRDDKKAKTARNNGKNGGNPTLCKEKRNRPSDKGRDKGGDKPHIPETTIPETTTLPPPIQRAPPDAKTVVAAFEEIRSELWPNAMPPAPRSTLETEAAQYLAMGGTVAVLVATLRAGMTGARNGGKSPPTSLKAYRLSLNDAAVGATKFTGRGDDRQNEGEDPMNAQWRERLVSFRDRGFWIAGWGPKPGEPGCVAPKWFVDEVLRKVAV